MDDLRYSYNWDNTYGSSIRSAAAGRNPALLACWPLRTGCVKVAIQPDRACRYFRNWVSAQARYSGDLRAAPLLIIEFLEDGAVLLNGERGILGHAAVELVYGR